MVALCSKTYYCQDAEGRDGLSSKGLQKNPIATLWLKRPIAVFWPRGARAVAWIVASRWGTYTLTGRSRLPCPTCTLKVMWWMTTCTQSPCTCELCSLPTPLPACLQMKWLPPWSPMPPLVAVAKMRCMTCGCSGPFIFYLLAVPASLHWPRDWWCCLLMSWHRCPLTFCSFTATCSRPTISWPSWSLALWNCWTGQSTSPSSWPQSSELWSLSMKCRRPMPATHKSHHYNTSIFHLVQNVPSHRTISLNATYIVLFKKLTVPGLSLGQAGVPRWQMVSW